MTAHVGDRITLEATPSGEPRRVGVIIAMPHADGVPPYQVRWSEDGRTTLIFPGDNARIEPFPVTPEPTDILVNR